MNMRIISYGILLGLSTAQAAIVFDSTYLKNYLSDWQEIDAVAKTPAMMLRMIPKDQSEVNWQQMISCGYITHQQLQVHYMNAIVFAEKFYKNLKRLCYNVNWQKLKNQSNDVVAVWQVTGCGTGALADQFEVVRFVATPEGIYHVHYLVKGVHVSLELKADMQRLVMHPGLFTQTKSCTDG